MMGWGESGAVGILAMLIYGPLGNVSPPPPPLHERTETLEATSHNIFGLLLLKNTFCRKNGKEIIHKKTRFITRRW